MAYAGQHHVNFVEGDGFHRHVARPGVGDQRGDVFRFLVIGDEKAAHRAIIE